MRLFTTLFSGLIFCSLLVNSQTVTQTIKGKVTDKDAKLPLVGVTVFIAGDSGSVALGTMTDS
ncbi:MAG: carboxypeptidase-like regulatory domain-containing protein, partial [Cytophagales bacterium]|nr:carboxypeptidase-like regulatory domain-containing protein [Cytophagales bacterium]